jgi:phage shock protein A
VISWIKSILSSQKSSQRDFEDITEELEKSLSEIKQSIADVTTEKKRLEIQKEKIEKKADKNYQKAENLVKNANEKKARLYLRKKHNQDVRSKKLKSEISNLNDIQSDLVHKKDQIEDKIQEIKTKKNAMNAKKITVEAKKTITKFNKNNFKIDDKLDHSDIEDSTDINNQIEKMKN